MLNYEVDPGLLEGFVPSGTILDSFDGRTYISLVAFQIRRTKLFGSLAVPFHTDFDEVNLRFYVRRKVDNEHRRGVVFIAKIARLAYGENYVRSPMRHRVSRNGTTMNAQYEWRLKDAWCKVHATASVAPAPAEEGTLEQFIPEHYWGYSAKRSGRRPGIPGGPSGMERLDSHRCRI
jgi:uncharacterized protein YqjF (DUF2071 family)